MLNNQIDDKDGLGHEPEVTLGEMRGLIRIVIWAALIGVGGWISIPIPGVPLSLQTFFVILAGLVEGPRRGLLAAGLYLLAGLLGLPVFTGGLGGPAILLRPSAGFALAFPLGAFVAGLAVRGRAGYLKRFLLAALGSILILVFGFVGIMINTQMEPVVAAKLTLTFLPGDIIKSVVAASIASSRFCQRVRKY